ncbi:hypothetical protein P3T23_007930 [Paraburkholderia sp. GAS448]
MRRGATMLGKRPRHAPGIHTSVSLGQPAWPAHSICAGSTRNHRKRSTSLVALRLSHVLSARSSNSQERHRKRRCLRLSLSLSLSLSLKLELELELEPKAKPKPKPKPKPRNDMQKVLCRTATRVARSRRDEPFVTIGTVRGTVWRRTDVASSARATLHGVPFPVIHTPGRDKSSAPFFCLLFFGKTKKSRCRPAQGRRQ